jgi:hypothetical protein
MSDKKLANEKDCEKLLKRAERYSLIAEKYLDAARKEMTEENILKAEKASGDAIAALFIAKLALRLLERGE